jgi:hypothetical protein
LADEDELLELQTGRGNGTSLRRLRRRSRFSRGEIVSGRWRRRVCAASPRRFGDLAQPIRTSARIVEGGEELPVAPIGRRPMGSQAWMSTRSASCHTEASWPDDLRWTAMRYMVVVECGEKSWGLVPRTSPAAPR